MTTEAQQRARLFTRDTYSRRDVKNWMALCGFACHADAWRSLRVTSMTWQKYRDNGITHRSGYRTVLAMRYLLEHRA